MRDFDTAFTNTNGVPFPDTEAINASSPSATDGTEFVKILIDDGGGWGWKQALMTAAGLTPNGSAEAVGNSQALEAWEILFGIPDKFISGLVPNAAAEAEHDITISTGEARSAVASSLVRILLASALTKQIDADWVAGNNAGGLATGARSVADTPDADTWYHLFVIKNNSTGVVDGGYDTSLTATNLLTDATGYTEFRRIGSVLVDSSSNLIAFTAVETAGGGLHSQLTTMVRDFTESPPDTNEQTKTLPSIPTGIRVEADMTFTGIHTSDAFANFGGPDESLPLPSSALYDFKFAASNGSPTARTTILTNISGQMKYRVDTAAVTSVKAFIHGWIDSRRN